MAGASRIRGLSLGLAVALTAGCAHAPAPGGWLPKPDAVGAEAFGGWIQAEAGKGSRRFRVDGELIAVEADSVLVLEGGSLVSLSRAEVVKATVAVYDLGAGGLGAWTVLGSLSSVSHGSGLVLSLPMWVIGGSVASRSASRSPRLDYPEQPWTEIARYARFPQGLPAGLNRSTLRGK